MDIIEQAKKNPLLYNKLHEAFNPRTIKIEHGVITNLVNGVVWPRLSRDEAMKELDSLRFGSSRGSYVVAARRSGGFTLPMLLENWRKIRAYVDYDNEIMAVEGRIELPEQWATEEEFNIRMGRKPAPLKLATTSTW